MDQNTLSAAERFKVQYTEEGIYRSIVCQIWTPKVVFENTEYRDGLVNDGRATGLILRLNYLDKTKHWVQFPFFCRNSSVTIASDELVDNAFLSSGAENPITLQRAYKGILSFNHFGSWDSVQLTSSATLNCPGILLTHSIATSTSLSRAILKTLSILVGFCIDVGSSFFVNEGK